MELSAEDLGPIRHDKTQIFGCRSRSSQGKKKPDGASRI